MLRVFVGAAIIAAVIGLSFAAHADVGVVGDPSGAPRSPIPLSQCQLVTGRDFTYLIDFGIAHNVASTKMTKTGAIIGTLAYIDPSVGGGRGFDAEGPRRT